MELLVVQIGDDLKVNLLLAQVESQLDLHVIQDALDVDERRLEVRAGLNQVLGQVLSGLSESAVAHIALPCAEDFLNQIVLEELH